MCFFLTTGKWEIICKFSQTVLPSLSRKQKQKQCSYPLPGQI